jgi:hypothetical protein
MTPLNGYRPAKGKFRPGNDISGLRDAPLGKFTMKTATPKQDAAIKCCPEKRLSASRTFPVCQPCSNEKVSDKRQRKEKARNVDGKSNLEDRGKEEEKHHQSASPIRRPGTGILRVHPWAVGFV